ncbi:sulfite exporter TauE/SafE family protein [Estrella lausannensis]|uniref:Probable membrane transporter protein n=1 Tax=Estrella lausannensis TaxID=483423 RepID=A0A0H5E2S9_9BACT|nr:sulfite exporter TauE/SafE family protein [Estrella lausannensis]CRX37510.1 protein of unknown function [Estrella lausannensis]
MEYLAICLTSLLAAVITLFSGFGLGTVLMPVFALFFPLQAAIAATAVVHLANNVFKAFIVGRLANWKIVCLFGLPAAFASAIGAYLLGSLADAPPLYSYFIDTKEFTITLLGVTVGSIIVFSSLFEIVPQFARLTLPAGSIPLGGFVSGFFGGLSGNQGAFRTAVLIKAGLTKEQFIGTGVISTILVDTVCVAVYGWSLFSEKFSLTEGLEGIIAAASLTAFLGSYIGSLLIEKITMTILRILVGIMLLLMGAAIALGLI